MHFLKKEEKKFTCKISLMKNNLSNYSFYYKFCYINLKIWFNKISFVYFSNLII